MVLKAKKIEVSVLLLHMAIMRKNIKKGFKSNYGAKEGKELLKSYDEVKEYLKAAFEELTENQQVKELHFNEKNITMIASFLSWYVLELEITLVDSKNKNPEDWSHVQVLKEFKENIDQVIQSYE